MRGGRGKTGWNREKIIGITRGHYRVRKRVVARAGVSFYCRNLVYCNTGSKGKGERGEEGSRLAGKLGNCYFTAFSLCLPSSPP